MALTIAKTIREGIAKCVSEAYGDYDQWKPEDITGATVEKITYEILELGKSAVTLVDNNGTVVIIELRLTTAERDKVEMSFMYIDPIQLKVK